MEKCVVKEAVISFNWRQTFKVTKSMTLELADRNMMMIRFLLLCKREMIFWTIFCIAGTQNQEFQIELLFQCFSNSSTFAGIDSV